MFGGDLPLLMKKEPKDKKKVGREKKSEIKQPEQWESVQMKSEPQQPSTDQDKGEGKGKEKEKAKANKGHAESTIINNTTSIVARLRHQFEEGMKESEAKGKSIAIPSPSKEKEKEDKVSEVKRLASHFESIIVSNAPPLSQSMFGNKAKTQTKETKPSKESEKKLTK